MRKKKLGRPKLPKTLKKSDLIRLYLTPQQAQKIRQAAKDAGVQPSDFIRQAAMARVEA